MTYLISNAERLIIKIGSSLLVDAQGRVRETWLTSLVDDIVSCKKKGQQVILVSSGSIALGRGLLKLKNQSLQLPEKQAAAAVGQIHLAQVYHSLLTRHAISVAQVLLTLHDSENRRHYINAKNTLETLLKLNTIPIINENDTVATAEIRYGDNDRLAARVAQMVSADTLVLLSDIDGLYTADPKKSTDARLIPLVTTLSAEIMAMAGDSSTDYGSGGMVTKLKAAKIAMQSGCKMVISNGQCLNPLVNIDKTLQKTWFIPEATPLNARKKWLATHLQTRGSLIIDKGAYEALQEGKSFDKKQ